MSSKLRRDEPARWWRSTYPTRLAGRPDRFRQGICDFGTVIVRAMSGGVHTCFAPRTTGDEKISIGLLFKSLLSMGKLW